MASINKVILVGNLGADPETRYMPSGDAVTNIRIATTDRYKDKQSGEMKELTEWHRIAFFGKLAEIAGQYLKKGSQIYVEGRIRTRQWEKDGQKQYSTEIVGETMQMLGGRQSSGGGDDSESAGGRQQRETASGGYGGSRTPNANASTGRGSQSTSQAARPQQAPSNGFEDMDDDIPF